MANIINSFHPGNATYREIADMRHEFGHYQSQAAFLEEVGQHFKASSQAKG